jgi:multiple sugar transport system substrate-binding protein
MGKPKLFVFVGVMLVIAQLIAACSPTATPEVPEVPEAPEAPLAEEPVAPVEEPAVTDPVVVAMWSGPEHDNLLDVAAKYEAQTGNRVIVEEIAREAFFDRLSTVVATCGRDYDVMYIMSDFVPTYVVADGLQDLNTFFEDPSVVSPDFDLNDFGMATDFFTFDGKLYALPSEGDTAWMWYRKDLLENARLEPPETWDEYYEAAKILHDPANNVYGAVIGASFDEAWWEYQYYLFGMGGQVLNPDYTVAINDEIGVKALTYYSNLLREGLVPPDVTTYGYVEVLETLARGNAALGIQWMAATMDLTDCGTSICDANGEPLLGYTLVPGVRQPDGSIERQTGGSQWSWGIPACSENKQGAYKFIEWLTGPVGAKQWALNGGIPGNIQALEDPEVVAEIPQFALLAEVMPYRNIFPTLTVSPEMMIVVNEGIVAAVNGSKDPQTAADDMAARLTELLRDGGYLP